MRTRLLSFLLIALMAIPAGWAAPASFAGAHSSHAAGSAPPCHTDESPAARDNCPCCPDHGGGSMADCLATCAVSLATPMADLPAVQFVGTLRPPVHVAVAFSSRTDSLFKPPPIL